MDVLRELPILLGVGSAVILCVAVQLGALLARRSGSLQADQRHDLSVVTGASLTLLGLIVGFSFSMAMTRYDQREICEDREASTIATEYLRAGLLSAGEAVRLRALLAEYLSQRLLFYTVPNGRPLDAIDRETEKLTDGMWSVVQNAAATNPDPSRTLVVSGLNELLSARDETRAAWWSRIPGGSWDLMAIIAVGSCLLMGYGAHQKHAILLMVFPLLVAVAFSLIAEIDSPGVGLVRVIPHNLTSLSQSLNGKS